MKLHEIPAPKGANKKRKRVGRGRGSGLGKTCGKGQKGQKSRQGNMNFGGFEGGQMPLQRRLPKIGFNHPKTVYEIVNLDALQARFDDGAVVDEQSLREKGLVKKVRHGIKILGRGAIDKKLTVRVHKISAGAREAISKAGGTVEVVGPSASTEHETRDSDSTGAPEDAPAGETSQQSDDK
ncbi:MAG: 50S ribosomal protein L15 [Deltaproteobacteria bacterium]|nr:MAG: 50S ribosomal protein L15 [Deltaproteobacteria bacterium]